MRLQPLVTTTEEAGCLKENDMIRKGQIVRCKKECQDEGDHAIVFVAVDDEDGGRVEVEAVNLGLFIRPRQIVRSFMVER